MTAERIGLREKIAYGLGDSASSMFWKLFSMYLMFFYTDVFGISAAAVATLFLVTRLFDAANDPLAGLLADRTETRWGRFRPYLLWMAVPFALFGVLTFTTPSLGDTGKLAYAYVTYGMMMVVYTLINVPYGSLMGVMTPDGSQRTSLATYRFIGAFGGSFVVLGIAQPLADFFGGAGGASPDRAFGWQAAAAVIAVLAAAQFLVTFAWTRERVRPMTTRTDVRKDLGDLARNGPWFLLLGAGIATIFFNSLRDGAAMYYFKYFLQEGEAFALFGLSFAPSTLYFTLGQAANIVGVVAARPLADRIGKKHAYLGAMFAAAIFSVFFYFVDKQQLGLVFLLQALTSIAAGLVLPLLWSMYADAADYSEWKTGRRATGLVFSASSMSQKFGWTIGGALVGFILSSFGYARDVAQTPQALHGMVLMLSLLPAAGAALSAIFMLAYPLEETMNKTIATELAARRQAVQP